MKIFLCGDVMLGGGIDQIMPNPSEPQIFESYLKDARDDVRIAEYLNGIIPRHVQFDYIWGVALSEWALRQPLIKVINLETSITKNNTPWENKGINYRMSPNNINALSVADIQVCSLANNHVLDWCEEGLIETLLTLEKAHIQYAGAGRSLTQAQKPAIIALPGKGRLLVFSMGTDSSGIPEDWLASSNKSGVWLLDDLSAATVEYIKEKVDEYRRPGDLCIASIHWGGNWGYSVPISHQTFAHQLIDHAGIHVVHGHSSHHPMGMEIYKNSPILYGCGDFINDYEGISGHEEFKSHLSLMYFLDMDKQSLKLKELELVPLEVKNFRLQKACDKDCQWLFETLRDKSRNLPARFELGKRGSILLAI